MSRYHLIKHRFNSFQRQKGRCHYCNAPMWLRNPESFAYKHKLNDGDIKRFQCTAEHLIARQDGGGDTSENIVAACLICNQTRHVWPKPLSAQAYANYVKGQIRNAKWHPKRLRHMLVV